MNELQKLNCPCVNVEKNSSYSTDYANVSKYKYLRITVYSEAQGNLYAVFSVDGNEKGIVQTFKITPNKWETFKVEVVCSYLKFEYVNGVIDNPRLLINVLGRYGILSGSNHVQISDFKTKEEPEEKEEEKKVEMPRGKSPFRRFVAKKLDSPKLPQKTECHDPRLPNLILRGNILIATQTNQLGVIVPPADELDYVLSWSHGKPQWIPVNELSNKWQI